MGEKYLEDALRYFFEKAAALIRLSLVNIGKQLDQFQPIVLSAERKQLAIGKYAIFGFFLVIAAFFYFIQLNSFFSPDYVAFSFLIVFLSGVFLYLNKA
ncbi:MAG: hypothetical protein KDD94_03140 [Calditrichaeota bacterium]|nr:hypothetical protein [Calditrichota bacterium]